MAFTFYEHYDSTDCGPACLKIVARRYGKFYAIEYLREKCFINKEGVSLRGIESAAEGCGFQTVPVKIPHKSRIGKPFFSKAVLSAILHWNGNLPVVLYKISCKRIWIADPTYGKGHLDPEEFKKCWPNVEGESFALLLVPTVDFKAVSNASNDRISSLKFLPTYLSPDQRNFFQPMMLAIQYIIGQLNALLQQLVGLIRSAQDARADVEQIWDEIDHPDRIIGRSANDFIFYVGDFSLGPLQRIALFFQQIFKQFFNLINQLVL